jgi:tetratricopeptide (TPR) repeat protein
MYNTRKAELLFIKALKSRVEDDAIDLLNQALVFDSKNPNILAFRSTKFAIIGEFSRAIGDYEKATALDPDNIFLLQAKALIEMREENFSEAILLLDEFISKIIAKIKEWENSAIKILSIGISWEKRYFDQYDIAYALYLRATALNRLGYLDDASKSLEKSLKLSNDERLGKLIAKAKSNVDRQKEEIIKRRLEEERRYKSTIEYRLKNTIRIFLAFPAWFYIAFLRALSENAISIIIWGVLCLPIAFFVQVHANSQVSGIHTLGQEATSPSILFVLFSPILIFCGFWLNCHPDIAARPREIFLASYLEDLSQRLTGLSIFEVISSDGKHFLKVKD